MRSARLGWWVGPLELMSEQEPDLPGSAWLSHATGGHIRFSVAP
jgi:hypothetical protein